MIFDLFKKEDPLPMAEVEKGRVYTPPPQGAMDAREVEKSFARLFSTDDGQRVLAYLQVITFQRALGPASSDEQLRYLEGQRAMVATILRLIDRGRKF